ncbi:MAG: hypothetical protein M3436_15600 [Pseudomonadota bacterium]|nr:hypothetical protein [Pseudomonadota bacterium]
MQNPSQQFIELGKQNFAILMRFTDLSLQGASRIFRAQTEAAKEVYAENAKRRRQPECRSDHSVRPARGAGNARDRARHRESGRQNR